MRSYISHGMSPGCEQWSNGNKRGIRLLDVGVSVGRFDDESSKAWRNFSECAQNQENEKKNTGPRHLETEPIEYPMTHALRSSCHLCPGEIRRVSTAIYLLTSNSISETKDMVVGVIGGAPRHDPLHARLNLGISVTRLNLAISVTIGSANRSHHKL
jgi:hypothetical protein